MSSLSRSQKPDTSRDTCLQVTQSSHSHVLQKGILWEGPLGVPLPNTAPAKMQLQALSGVQRWAGLIRKKCSALHIATTLLMTPVSLLGLFYFSTTSIFSTDDCLLLQSDCGGCARAWLAFSHPGQGTKQAPHKQNGSHRKMLPDVQKVHQSWCPAPVHTGHAGKLYKHQALGAAALLCHTSIFCPATAKGPVASRPDSACENETE